MESALGDEAWGPTPDRLQESNISDFVEDAQSPRCKDELETIPVEEIQDLKPEDLQESAPAEATQDTKPGTGQAMFGWSVDVKLVMGQQACVGSGQVLSSEASLFKRDKLEGVAKPKMYKLACFCDPGQIEFGANPSESFHLRMKPTPALELQCLWTFMVWGIVAAPGARGWEIHIPTETGKAQRVLQNWE
ncbi:hypothetical protein WISP_120168 [Willisornis vidua]|uniref:Uncharacterized protein n=1 Tax=Willisornis vidua TaxID=1566151 RepID=A0ABQ9CSZ7_9PASS|nr:hypothetical protein WISP_120168 [Willisornis vidua]